MIKEIVGYVGIRKIVKISDKWTTRFKIKQGNQYIGKISDGGYKSKYSAIRAAKNTLKAKY